MKIEYIGLYRYRPIRKKAYRLLPAHINYQKYSFVMFSRFFLHRNISSHLGPDFKIILLQRDPRATINSLRTEPQEWLSGAAAPTKICGNLLQDFTAMQEVCIYLLINY